MTFQEELLEILKEQLESLENIRQLTYEKTDIIIENKIDELETITSQEEKLINNMGNIEVKRLKLLNNWGLSPDMSLREVIDKASEGKEELIEIKEKLLYISSEIKERNITNSELINDNLQWLDFNMNLISDIQSPTTYGNGNGMSKSSNSLFDRKV